jgi:L-ascorbate metabolism protein UlaG (beta-lactamase superfamily)
MRIESHARIAVLALLLTSACARPVRATAHVHSVTRAAAATLTYLGTAGWRLESAAGTLLVDPYVTRTSADDDAGFLLPDELAIEAFTPARADAILVGHSHFDHVLDVPAIARRTGARVVGSESTANLLRAAGVGAGQILVARGGERFALGPFRVLAVPGLHSLTGQPNEPIPPGVTLPMSARGYGEGGTLQYLVGFEGHTVFFVGSANFIEERVRGLRPDVAVVAIGLRDRVRGYTCRLLTALGRPRVVLPNHFDAFRTPLRPGHMDPSDATRAELAAFTAEVRACAPATRVEVPVHLRPIALGPVAAR